MKRFLLTAALLIAHHAFAADDVATLAQRVAALEKEVAGLKAENTQLKQGFAAQHSEYAKRVYTLHVLPLVKPMLNDFGLDESLIMPVERVENLADAYRPLLLMIQKLNAVTEVAAPK